jgi:hypothetical protein
MLGAAALVIFRAGILPRWLGWLGAIAATLSFVSVPFAAKVPPLGMLLTFIWIISVSIVLTRRAVRRDPRVAVATA